MDLGLYVRSAGNSDGTGESLSLIHIYFGVDLLKEERPCMFYTADNMIVGRNDTLLYLYNYETQQEFTYRCV